MNAEDILDSLAVVVEGAAGISGVEPVLPFFAYLIQAEPSFSCPYECLYQPDVFL